MLRTALTCSHRDVEGVEAGVQRPARGDGQHPLALLLSLQGQSLPFTACRQRHCSAQLPAVPRPFPSSAQLLLVLCVSDLLPELSHLTSSHTELSHQRGARHLPPFPPWICSPASEVLLRISMLHRDPTGSSHRASRELPVGTGCWHRDKGPQASSAPANPTSLQAVTAPAFPAHTHTHTPVQLVHADSLTRGFN